MSVLVIDKPTQDRIEVVKKYAIEHKYSLDDLKAIIAQQKPPPGDNPEHVVHIPGTGMRAVLTLEEQPCGLCWHVSLSIPKKNAHPSPSIVEPLFDIFGLDRNSVVRCWLEPIGEISAFNIVTKATSVDPKSN